MSEERKTPSGAPIAPCEGEVCQVVACETCLAEIPADLAQSLEAPDYVHYFCGLECLAKWQEKAGTKS
jgi:hypothetical protein